MSSPYNPNATSGYNPHASAPTKSGPSKTMIYIIVAVVAILVVVGIIVAIVVATGSSSDANKATIDITIQSANTKEKWMETMVANFDTAGSDVNEYNGKKIKITLHNTGSTFKPALQPNIWSPANSQFIRLQETADGRQYVSSESTYCKSTTNIPVGVAMWEDQARALGWDTDTSISFEVLADLALHKDGWASINPNYQWGKFKYGHGHPDVSNSGRLSVVANIFALSNATDTATGLSSTDVAEALKDEDVIALEQAVYHLGKIDTDILTRMLEHGPTYLHAVANYESNVINWNQDFASELGVWGDTWVFIYLEDGTFWMQHPLCVLDQADWTSNEQTQAALKFIEYATSDENLKQLLQYGIRPDSSSIDITCCGSTITKANGADPTQNIETVKPINYPSDAVMQQVIDGWHRIKKPAAFALVVDTSGSMVNVDTDSNGNKYSKSRMVFAKEAVRQFVNSTDPQDYIMGRSFAGVFSSPGNKSMVEDAAYFWINTFQPSGGTPLYGKIAEAYDDLKKLKLENVAKNISWNYALVAMTDGEPSDNNVYTSTCTKFTTEAGVKSDLCNTNRVIDEYSKFPGIIHFFPIIFGGDAQAAYANLDRMAEISAGKAFLADSEDLGDVYFQISLEL